MNCRTRKTRRLATGPRCILIGLILTAFAAGCGGGDIKHEVVVFVQATKNSRVNEAIMRRYVIPVFRRLSELDGGVRVEMYPITGNTVAASSFFTATLLPGLDGRRESAAAAAKISRLSSALDQVYLKPNKPELVDILGSIFVLDRKLGTRPSRGFRSRPLTAIFITDLMQLSGDEGWDFSIYGKNAQNLDACKAALETEYGEKLNHHDRFSEVRVLILKLARESLYEGLGTSTLPPVKDAHDVELFWRRDVFGSLLGSDVAIESTDKPSFVVGRFIR